jgi:translocation and assembly module TamB
MRRALKITAWTAAAAALLIVASGGFLYLAGNTDPGRRMIENLTRRLTSGQVSLSGLGGSFPQRLTLEHLALRDARGVWLTADRISVAWSPPALLVSRVQVQSLHAAAVDMERLPEPATPGSGPVSIPRIDVAKLWVDRLTLGPELAGARASLVVAGNAHLRSVRDMVIDATAHRIDGDGSYECHLRFDRERMDARLDLHEPAGGPLENLIGLPGLGALAATASLSGPRAAEHLELAVDAGLVRGRVQGSLDLDRPAADVEFAFDSPALAPRPDVAWQRARIHGRWHGSLESPNADAQVEAGQLRWPGGSAASVTADLKADSGSATLHALVGGLEISGLRPQLLQDAPLTIDASMRLDAATRPLDLSASHRLFSLHGTTELTPAVPGQHDAILRARLPDLAPWAALAGQTLRGSALLKAQVHSDRDGTRLSLDSSAAIAAGRELWSGAVGERPTLQLSGTLTPAAVRLDNLKFTGRTLTLTGGGELSRPAAAAPAAAAPAAAALRARWELNVSDLTSVSTVLSGTLKGSGTFDGALNSLAAQAQVSATVSVRGSPASTVAAAVRLRGLPAAPTGTLSMRGAFDGAPVQVDVAVQSPAGAWRALIERADWKSGHAAGDLSFAPATAQTQGELRLGIDRLADLDDVLGTAVAGSAAGSIAVHPEHGRAHAELHLDAHDLTVGRFAGNAQLAAEGGTDALALKLDVQSAVPGGAKASLSARGSLDLHTRTLALTAAGASYRGEDFRLLAAARIALADGVAVDDVKIGAQTAQLEVQGEILPALDLRASLTRVEPALINKFVPGLLESGTLEMHAQLQGSVGAPTGEVRFSALGMRMADDAAFGLPSLDVQATAQLQGTTADVDARLVAGTASRLKLTGRAPLSAEGDLNLKIDGELDVGIINPLLEARGQRAAGELAINATVAGKIDDPQIAGTLDLTKGSVRDYGRGVGLTDITATLIGSAGTLQIKTFTATAAPGTLSMSGHVGVLQPKIPVDLTIQAQNAQPLVSKLVTANLNADLHVTGTARERLDIVGNVHLNRTLIGIPNGMPSNVAVLDVRRRGKAARPVPEKPLVVGLDVSVAAPREVLVQGRGLDAEMGTDRDLHVGGTLDTPYVSGSLGLLRGNFSLSGNKLDFTRDSSITFNGAGLKTTIDPTLDFKAQTTVGDVTATLTISGYADAPTFEFTSSPVLPPDEIMARLLFGVPGSQLSALQLAQTGAALASLTGVGGGSGLNPLAKLQKSLGLDRLNVGAATTQTATGPENSGASIEAGRYVSKRIYIEARQSTQGNSQLQAVVDLTKHLKLQTRLGNGTATVVGTTPENDPGSSVGVVYQFEY